MAERLGRDYSIIKREIKRNSGNHLPYAAAVAQSLAEKRARKTNVRKLEKPDNQKLKKFVIEKLREDWSPDQIAGTLKENPPADIFGKISHESIYSYVYNYSEKHFHLSEHLRTGRKERQRRFSRKKRVNTIENRVSIHQRPVEISEKKTYGHWENDLMEFGRKQGEVLSVKYERKSMLCKMHKLPNKQAEENEGSIAETIESLPHDWFRSVTRDNGKENANHEKTLLDFNVPTYFCDAYASWQKGGVENLNKLIRQYLPKQCDFAKITDNDIFKIQEKLNSRPRKSNNYLTFQT